MVTGTRILARFEPEDTHLTQISPELKKPLAGRVKVVRAVIGSLPREKYDKEKMYEVYLLPDEMQESYVYILCSFYLPLWKCFSLGKGNAVRSNDF